MSNVNDFLAAASGSTHTEQANRVARVRPSHPKGWEPGIAWKGTEGTVISEPSEVRDPEWDGILQRFEFDPEKFEVVEPIEVRSWEGFIKDAKDEIQKTTLWYHKARIIRRVDDDARLDIEALIQEVKRHRPTKARPVGEAALVAGIGDVQFGKKGTEDALARCLAVVDGVIIHAKALRKTGFSLGSLYAVQGGDLIENTAGHYAMQTYEVELNRAEQIRLARRFWVSALKTWAPHFDRIVVPVTPGNHPENRNGSGKAYTDFKDNDDLEIMVQVSEVLAENPDAYGHISIVLPDEDLTVTLDVAGQIGTFAHGHQFPKKKNEYAWEWWDGQARGMKPPGDATFLFSFHRHTFVAQQRGVRTWFQGPTEDNGSEWYESVHGEQSMPGVLSFTVNAEGWDHLRIL